MIRARPVGVLHMTDGAGGDAKLIAVPHDKLSVLYKDVKGIHRPAGPAAGTDQALLRELQGSRERQVGQGRRLGQRRRRPRRDHQGRGRVPEVSAPRRKEAPQPRAFSFSLADRQGRSRSPAPLGRPSPRSPTDIRSRRWSATANRARRSGQACCAGDRCGYPAAAGQHFLVGPEALVEIFPRQRPSQVGEQAAGQAVFAFGQADRRAGPGHGQLGIVEAEVVESLHLMLRGTRSPWRRSTAATRAFSSLGRNGLLT